MKAMALCLAAFKLHFGSREGGLEKTRNLICAGEEVSLYLVSPNALPIAVFRFTPVRVAP
jgi:hypothetical protein